MLLLLGQNHFSVEKMLDFDVFNECVTNRQTDRPTDTAYYSDARTHLKRRRLPNNHKKKHKTKPKIVKESNAGAVNRIRSVT